MTKKLVDLVAILEELREKGRDVVITSEGEVREAEALNGCSITYVNCRTKVKKTQILKPGETFAYGDWDGLKCVRKVFTC